MSSPQKRETQTGWEQNVGAGGLNSRIKMVSLFFLLRYEMCEYSPPLIILSDSFSPNQNHRSHLMSLWPPSRNCCLCSDRRSVSPCLTSTKLQPEDSTVVSPCLLLLLPPSWYVNYLLLFFFWNVGAAPQHYHTPYSASAAKTQAGDVFNMADGRRCTKNYIR